MTWSDAARKASAEARRRKSKGGKTPTKITKEQYEKQKAENRRKAGLTEEQVARAVKVYSGNAPRLLEVNKLSGLN